MARRLPVALFAAFVASAAAPWAGAAQLHTWVDAQGVVHVEDFAPPATHSPRRRAIPASSRRRGAKPEAVRRRAPHWWERAWDAPPDEIDKAARLYNIPSELVRAVIAAESAGDATARSHAGAIGLMQLMPTTAGAMYVQDPVDPAQNILGGTRYLRYLANAFNGDILLVLAAYNAGPEAVRKYGGVPPFDETRKYVRKVIGYYQELRRDNERRRRELASASAQDASSLARDPQDPSQPDVSSPMPSQGPATVEAHP